MLSRFGRLLAAVLAAVFYTLGVLAACVVVSALFIATATRLGWSDVRKRADGIA